MAVVYQYECKTCETGYEVEQSLKDDKFTEHECPKCESVQPCIRVITGSNFVLVGTCWASDGYWTHKEKMDKLGDLM